MQISQVVPKAVWRICVDHIQLWAIGVWKLPSKSKVAMFSISIRSVIIENIVQSSCFVHSQREMSRTAGGMSQGAILKSYTVFVRAAFSPRGYMGIYWRWSHQTRPCPFPYHEAEEISLSIQDQGGDDQMNWTPHLCPHGSKMFGSSWILFKTSGASLSHQFEYLEWLTAATQRPWTLRTKKGHPV